MAACRFRQFLHNLVKAKARGLLARRIVPECHQEIPDVGLCRNQQIHAIDVALGMIRDELEKQGVADNTVIIYTADNGFICGSHGYGSKVLPMEESSRVPLMIYDPHSKSTGKKLRTQSLTGNIDFAPTIRRLLGLSPKSAHTGRAMLR